MTLEDLIKQAETDGLWIHCTCQDLWFSPKELREENAKGKFRWSVENFRLRRPEKRLEQLELEAEHARMAIANFKVRMVQNV